MNTDKKEFTDTQRLEWGMRHPTSFKGICANLGASSPAALGEIRKLIDVELREEKHQADLAAKCQEQRS